MNALIPRSRASADFIDQRIGAELEVARHRTDLESAHLFRAERIAAKLKRAAKVLFHAPLAHKWVVAKPARPRDRVSRGREASPQIGWFMGVIDAV